MNSEKNAEISSLIYFWCNNGIPYGEVYITYSAEAQYKDIKKEVLKAAGLPLHMLLISNKALKINKTLKNDEEKIDPAYMIASEDNIGILKYKCISVQLIAPSGKWLNIHTIIPESMETTLQYFIWAVNKNIISIGDTDVTQLLSTTKLCDIPGMCKAQNQWTDLIKITVGQELQLERILDQKHFKYFAFGNNGINTNSTNANNTTSNNTSSVSTQSNTSLSQETLDKFRQEITSYVSVFTLYSSMEKAKEQPLPDNYKNTLNDEKLKLINTLAQSALTNLISHDNTLNWRYGSLRYCEENDCLLYCSDMLKAHDFLKVLILSIQHHSTLPFDSLNINQKVQGCNYLDRHDVINLNEYMSKESPQTVVTPMVIASVLGALQSVNDALQRLGGIL